MNIVAIGNCDNIISIKDDIREIEKNKIGRIIINWGKKNKINITSYTLIYLGSGEGRE
jgi:hypothetical protein